MGTVSTRLEPVLLIAAVVGCAPPGVAAGGKSASGKGDLINELRNAILTPIVDPETHRTDLNDIVLVIDELGPPGDDGGPQGWNGDFVCQDAVSDCVQHHQDVRHGVAARVFEVAVEAAAIAALGEVALGAAGAVGLAELFGGADALAGFAFYEVAGFGTIVAVSHEVVDALKKGDVRCWSDQVVHGSHSGDCLVGTDGPAGDPVPDRRLMVTVVGALKSILASLAHHSFWSRVKDQERDGECRPRWPWLIDAIEAGTYAPTPGAPEWWLDRIDQRSPQLDCKSELVDRTGKGVRIYLVDGGISWIRRWAERLRCEDEGHTECHRLLASADPDIPEWMLKANESKLENLIRSAGPQIAGPQFEGDENFGFETESKITNDHGLRTVSILHALVPDATLVDVNVWDPAAPGGNVFNWVRVKEAISWIADDVGKYESAVVSSNVWHEHGDDELEALFDRISERAAVFAPVTSEIEPLPPPRRPDSLWTQPGAAKNQPFPLSAHADRVGGSYLYPYTFVGRENSFRGKELEQGQNVVDAVDVLLEDTYARTAILDERVRLGLPESFAINLDGSVRLLAPSMDILVASLWRRMKEPDSGWVPQQHVYGTSWSLAMTVGAAAMYLEKRRNTSPHQVRDAVHAAGIKMEEEAFAGRDAALLYVGKEAEAIWAQ